MRLSGRRMIDRREQALATIHSTRRRDPLLDTANIHAPDAARIGHNEELVRGSLSYTPGGIAIATKVASRGSPAPTEMWGARHTGCPAVGGGGLGDTFGRPGRRPSLHRADPTVHFNDQIAGLMAVQKRGLAARDRSEQRDVPDAAASPRDRRWTCRTAVSSSPERAVPAISSRQRRPGHPALARHRLPAGSSDRGGDVRRPCACPRRQPPATDLARLLAQSPVVILIPVAAGRRRSCGLGGSGTRISMSVREVGS